MVPELVFGLKDGKATHISEVESGLNCDCVCVKCRRQLVAKKGDIRIHHFAHEDDSDCQLSAETSLHLAAKEILQHEMRIKIPLPDFYPTGNRTLKFDEVKLVQRCDSIIPDILAYIKGSPLIIEIKVSHAVDDVKIQKIKQLGYSAIEIDLSGTDCSTLDSIKEDVIENVQNKTWLYNAREAEKKAPAEKRESYGSFIPSSKERGFLRRFCKHNLRAWLKNGNWTVEHCTIVKEKPICAVCIHYHGQNKKSPITMPLLGHSDTPFT